MSFLDKIATLIPFGKKEEILEYFFALNISSEKLTAALWTIEGKQLKILQTAEEFYSSNDEITSVSDKLLDQVIGLKEIEPQKILFGVPSSWLLDENLKDEYLKLLKNLVKELELTPMAYVATANSLIHFLEKEEGVPTTAILAGFEKHHITVTVVRAGKLDGVKVVARGDSSGIDIEKALLTFSDVETLPSRILIYGLDTQELKNQLLSFSWMQNLSFLHFPKIDILGQDVEIKSVCLAGAVELDSTVTYKEVFVKKTEVAPKVIEKSEGEAEKIEEKEDFGFIAGDVAVTQEKEGPQEVVADEAEKREEEKEILLSEESNILETKKQFDVRRFIPKTPFFNLIIIGGIIGILGILSAAILLLPKAEVKIFVEPRILEKDTQVTADPKIKEVNEEAKIIPGQLVDTEVSGSSKDLATGKKQIGESAKGTIIIRNKTDASVSLSKGTILTSPSSLKFSLDLSVNVASKSADDGTWGKATATVTAQTIGADGNLPSGVDLTVVGLGTDKIIAKSEGNFSGGTSKEVTVVSDSDQKRLLASLASDLRRQAQQKLQEKLPDKKILQEALSEEILKKSYSKNINDQANEFSLNLTIKFKGIAFEDKDLKLIVSKLVTTQVPEGFELNLSETETQADVSKLEKDGRLIFLARFKAKLIPKIDIPSLKNKIKGKTPDQVVEILKNTDNVLGSEIKIMPSLPKPLQRIPLLGQNIKIEVGLK